MLFKFMFPGSLAMKLLFWHLNRRGISTTIFTINNDIDFETCLFIKPNVILTDFP